MQLKEAKCEVEGPKGELIEAYFKIKFLELEIIQVNVKVEHISTKKLDNVLSSQKSSHDKTGSKGATSKALVSSFWRTRTHNAELFQVSCTQKG